MPLSTGVATLENNLSDDSTGGAPALAATGEIPIPPAANTELIVWTTPAFSPFDDSPSSLILAEQITAFETTNPNVTVKIELKEAVGPGSINSYLSTGRPVAPSILPDVILMPTEQMLEAANIGLIFPVNDFIPASIVEDTFPAAQELVNINDNIWGIPYALHGMTHTAYDTDTFSRTIPMQLPALTDTAGVFVLPAAGQEGSKILLQYYLESGGQLTNENGQPILEVVPLTAALTAFKDARDRGVIHPQSYSLQTLGEAWQLYRTDSANIVLTRPDIYLTNQNSSDSLTSLPADAFAPVPGPSSALQPLLSGWAWSLSTPDPAKQELGVAFIDWMTNTENLGRWSEASGYLPARRAAFETWTDTCLCLFPPNAN
jgi:ABC-type glycerol-3-phosphate transport system substrate-binding protein